MKLVTYELFTPIGAVRRVGALLDDALIVDLLAACETQLAAKHRRAEAHARAHALIPFDMVRFLRRGEEAMEAAWEALCFVEQSRERIGIDGQTLIFDMDEARLLSPLPRPSSIRDFICFEQHIKNGFERMNIGPVPEAWYRIPAYYKGNPHSVIGHDQDVIWPSFSESLDYELELAIVIGKPGKNIPQSAARSYVAGYTIFNDISARDVQGPEMSVGLGPSKSKDFDTGNILGPCLVTPDEFDGRSARMVARVNGEVWSEGNLSDMHYSFEDLIVYVSKDETLRPGDVFGSGTVGFGCGLELGRSLTPGDIVELEVEGVGILRNRITRPTQA
ncbi:MAG: fumarylacetoacetate hydrolase family protein [Chloroflexi bacterium]|nr:fumarylacetoacetate hydrolase family protein [Chloroflexota bacterium]